MGAWRRRVWEGDEIDRDVPNHPLLVKNVAYAFAYGHHVHVGQRLLWEEAASIDVSSGCEAVHRTDNLHLTVRLDQEGDTGTSHLMTHACWSSFDDATDSAEGAHILCPALEEQRHRNNGLLWQILG